MSWAAHNPEAYDEILKKAVVHKLTKELTANGFTENIDADTVTTIVESIFESTENYGTHVRDKLIDWAQREIIEAERDHFARIADSRE
jgi:ribosomal protein L17